MACIIKKKTKYTTYYVIAETARVNGKPRIVKQWYLGTIEKMIALTEGNPSKEQPSRVDCIEEGATSELFRIAKDLGVVDVVNHTVKKRKQGMSVGDYVLIAALNRAIEASSKNKIEEWVDSTALHLYMPIEHDKLSSQNFWDQFNKIGEKEIEAIGTALAKKVVEIENIPLDCLIYDTTNYFNYWDVTNPSDLAQMTKSKAGKNNLRHIGLALAVDRDWGLPILHKLYPANEHDSKVFNKTLDGLFKQIKELKGEKNSVTFVFDKGNNSEETILALDESRHHFVGSRSPFHHKDLCRVLLEEYKSEGDFLYWETRAELYGKQRRLIVCFNEGTYQRQLYRLEKNIDLAKKEISDFKKKAKGADGRSTKESILRKGQEILEQYHVSGLLDIEIEEQESGYRISARQNAIQIEEAKTRFGKQILFSDRESLPATEIIKIYKDRNIVEEAFRLSKSDHWVKMDPAFHWTDSKIRVHALTCIIALLLVRIAHKRAKQAGFENGVDRMMELLYGVKSALMYYPKSNKPIRQLCHLSKEQTALLTKLKSPLIERM